MKKLLFVLAIGSFAACNNAAEPTAAEVKIDAAANEVKEAVNEAADSIKATLDSTGKAIVDSAHADHNHAH